MDEKVGKYGGKNLYLGRRDANGYPVLFKDGYEIKGLRLKKYNPLLKGFEIEDDTIYVSANETLTFEGGFLVHNFCGVKLGYPFIYGIDKGSSHIPDGDLVLHDRSLGKRVCIRERHSSFTAYIPTELNYDIVKEAVDSSKSKPLSISWYVKPSQESFPVADRYMQALCHSNANGGFITNPPLEPTYFCGIKGDKKVFLSGGFYCYIDDNRLIPHELVNISHIEPFEDLEDLYGLADALDVEIPDNDEKALVYVDGRFILI